MFNISQGLIAALEGYIISGKMDQALLYGGSTLIATAVGDYIPTSDMLGSGALYEKQLQEPLASCLIALLGQYLFKLREEGKHKYIKTCGKAFIISSSSAGLNELIANKAIGGNSYSQAREVLAAKKVANPNQNYRVESNILI